MPMATECILNGRRCSVAEALNLRDTAVSSGQDYPDFTCVECGEPVKPHREGTTDQGAHFEHRERNAQCSLSHRAR